MGNCLNCHIFLTPDYFRSHFYFVKFNPTPVIENNINKNYEKILDSLISTELFCIGCCIKHSNTICTNSNIPLRDFFVGYFISLKR